MFPLPVPFSPENSSLSSLPTNLTTQEEQESNIEAKLASYQPTSNTDSTIIILKAFVSHLPRDGTQNIAQDILDCKSNNELRTLTNHLLTAVLVPMKVHGRTPIATPSPRFGADDSVEEIASELVNLSSCNDQAWLKAACLSRDSNRCIISGSYDIGKAEHLSASELQRTATADTQAVHIIPFTMGSFAEPELRNTATIWDAMYRCFPSIRSRANLSASTINNACNALTMDMILHRQFGNFRLALRPTSTENVYRVNGELSVYQALDIYPQRKR